MTTPAAPIRLREDVGDELLGAGRGERLVEFEHQHRVGAGVGEQRLALVERGQAERRHVGLEVTHRMRVEGGDDHRPPLVKAARDRPPDHRLVAEVEAVEIAEGDDAALEVVGNTAVEGQPLHWAAAALVGRKVFAKQPVFVDREIDHEQVEDAEQDQAEVVGEAVAVELVGDERAEHGEARRIGPQLLAQQADHQDRFDDPVAEQIESVEIVLGDGEVRANSSNCRAIQSFGSSISSSWLKRLIELRIVAC